MSIYDTLNTEQKKAVLQTEGPVLILAGAGSGKTRVLTHRVAFLIDECGVNPWNIMAITFTNKAAGEMRERVNNIVGYGAESIWVTTFHSTCVRILRRHADRIGYDKNFVIYDSDDSKSVMKDVCKRFSLETTTLKVRQFLNKVSHAKDNLVLPSEYSLSSGNSMDTQRIAKAYQEYQASLRKNNAMDFDDLILNTVQLFRTCPDVLDYYQERFRYIMVDEYQDTNNAQFELIRLLADKYKNVCVVGDDDQSIYRFRGANVRNILDFEKIYPEAVVVKLEQNYRSTQNILDAANAVIRNNRGRMDKALWTQEGSGDKVVFKQFSTGLDEAAFLVQDILKQRKNGKADYKDIAILYRTNAQSRLIEEQMVKEGVPYNIVGGTNFYSRREIKDILSYLKTIANGRDDLAVRRIINVPKRGIGATTLQKVQTYADSHDLSFYDALAYTDEIVGGKAAEKLKNFDLMIQAFRTKQQNMTLSELLRDVIDTTDYLTYLRTLDEDNDIGDDNDRRQNVDELVSKLVDYEEKAEEPTLNGFLEEVALVADIDNVEGDEDRVLLMTLHSAKGLEFPYVYLSGMEEGMFPSYMTLMAEESDPQGMEEERRLAYVGITRAKEHLTLTAAKSRMVRGELQYNNVSRFVEEIPEELLDGNLKKAGEPTFLFGGYEDTIGDYDDMNLGTGKMFRRNEETSYGSRNSSQGAYDNSLRGGYHTPSSGESYGSSIYGAPKRPTAKLRKPTEARNKPYAGLGTLTKGTPVNAEPDYIVGDRVLHVKFGEGTVMSMEKGPKDYKVTVIFDAYGQKVMYAAFAKLKKI